MRAAVHSCCGYPRRSLSFLLASGVKGVCASRPSELDMVGEAPRAAGGRRALRAGRRQLRMSLCIGGIERGTYERKLII